MSLRARTLPLLFLTSLAGCDRSGAWPDCVGPGDPSAAPGSRRDACPTSQFPDEDYRTREVSGVVRRGEDVVPGAAVRIDPSPGFASAAEAQVAKAVTDAAGSFTGLRTVAFRYDLFVNLGASSSGNDDVMVFRELASRHVEPSLEGAQTFARAWTARVAVSLARPVAPGQALAFYVSGDPLYTAQAASGNEVTLLTRDYSSAGTLRVVEYDPAGGLETATAYGKADFQSIAGTTVPVPVELTPIDRVAEPKFTVVGPAGFDAKAIEIRFAFSRTSGGVLATIPLGTSRPLHIIPDCPYTYRVVATNGAVTSDTGEVGFDILETASNLVVVSAPPTIVGPAAGESRAVGESLVVDGPGVFEHLLAPKDGGPSVRIVTAQKAASIPDLGAIAPRAAAGNYTWTVRSYPTAHFADELAGLDVRRGRPMTTSAPRTILLK